MPWRPWLSAPAVQGVTPAASDIAATSGVSPGISAPAATSPYTRGVRSVRASDFVVRLGIPVHWFTARISRARACASLRWNRATAFLRGMLGGARLHAFSRLLRPRRTETFGSRNAILAGRPSADGTCGEVDERFKSHAWKACIG